LIDRTLVKTVFNLMCETGEGRELATITCSSSPFLLVASITSSYKENKGFLSLTDRTLLCKLASNRIHPTDSYTFPIRLAFSTNNYTTLLYWRNSTCQDNLIEPFSPKKSGLSCLSLNILNICCSLKGILFEI
jgi:hypothetical protein